MSLTELGSALDLSFKTPVVDPEEWEPWLSALMRTGWDHLHTPLPYLEREFGMSAMWGICEDLGGGMVVWVTPSIPNNMGMPFLTIREMEDHG